MDRTERFYKIKNLLSQRTVVGFAEMLSELEVSSSTLKRDLEYLRSRLNVPIEWNRDAGGYRLAVAPGADGSAHELQGLWFSPSEIHALLTMQQLLTNLDAGGLLRSHIAPLMDRLNALLGDEGSETAELRRRVHIVGLAQRTVAVRHFKVVATALARRKRLHISYRARGNGEATAREVSPLRLLHYRENWYLDAWCHLRDGLRNFALDAVSAAQMTDISALEVGEAKLDAIFGPSYGIFSGGAIRWARLRFSPERARWVASEQWHPQQVGTHEGDGGYLLRIPYSDHRELIMDVLKHGSHCEVLGPPSLRRAVAGEAAMMAESYLRAEG